MNADQRRHRRPPAAGPAGAKRALYSRFATEPFPMHVRPPITGVVVTRNEEAHIARCLRSMAPVCREIVVLDSGSSDATVAIARAEGAIVEHQEWLGFASQKNVAISRANQPWVLLLDADEWLEEEAQAQILALFGPDGAGETADVWRLRRRAHYLGRRMRHGSFSREPVYRLFRAHLRHEIRPVHEQLDLTGARVAEGGIFLEHDTPSDADAYWARLQGYARLWAQDQANRGRYVLPGRGWLAAAALLIRGLVFQGGLLDGMPSLRLHWIHARFALRKYRYLQAELGF